MAYRWEKFEIGTRVVYVGGYTPELVGLEGTVHAFDQNGMRARHTDNNINVLWDSGETKGVYSTNIELIENREPDWEI
jgi:hypothetical protein